ncbi:MAG: hypothetical protein LBJ00_16355 [Planctomycetaceae bacterium]|nr:hypothetical protein [Planctomycetaceae bacterium]
MIHCQNTHASTVRITHANYTVASKAVGFASKQPLHVVTLACPASGILKQPECI